MAVFSFPLIRRFGVLTIGLVCARDDYAHPTLLTENIHNTDIDHRPTLTLTRNLDKLPRAGGGEGIGTMEQTSYELTPPVSSKL
jgi:hypothetical protein